MFRCARQSSASRDKQGYTHESFCKPLCRRHVPPQADTISHEYVKMLFDETTFTTAGGTQGLGIIFDLVHDPTEQAAYVSDAVLLMLSQAADFHVRIRAQMVNRFPLLLAWFSL